MRRPKPPRNSNRLSGTLPRAERSTVLADCESVDMTFAHVLWEPGDRIRHGWFPLRGPIALIAQVDDHGALEVGSAGNDGLFGFPPALGSQRKLPRPIVESPGPALRIDAARLREHLAVLSRLQKARSALSQR